MSSVSSFDTGLSTTEPGAAMINIHGNVTIKFRSLTINNGPQGTGATIEMPQAQQNQSDSHVKTAKQQNLADSTKTPEIQPVGGGHPDNANGAQVDQPQPLSDLAIHTPDSSPERVGKAVPSTTNVIWRGLYSDCRLTGCTERFVNMFKREEHEVEQHLFCGDCQRTFSTLKEVQFHRDARLAWDPISCPEYYDSDE